jgi:hypothetical protein
MRAVTSTGLVLTPVSGTGGNAISLPASLRLTGQPGAEDKCDEDRTPPPYAASARADV